MNATFSDFLEALYQVFKLKKKKISTTLMFEMFRLLTTEC